MPKSKYPNELDTSIEIPAVRDNIIEVGSDVLNSIRSALFQIERTLGINPQGAVGNTVSDRLNKAIDGNGNILKEALDRANVLSGPIVDSDVSKTAAINESKLRLNYPTQLLQDEVSQLMNQVDAMLATIDELAVLFNAHVHTSATNRHKGQAITIEAIDNTSSSTGITSLDITTSQDAFESVFQSHINYDGSDISISNRSHEADQLFFDTTDVSAYIDSDDVQGAIEDILAHAVGQLDDHQNHQHDNGVARTGQLVSSLEDDVGQLILDSTGITYYASISYESPQGHHIGFNTAQDVPEISIKKSDILQITDESGTAEYQISEVVYDPDDETKITGVYVFARFGEDAEVDTTAKIYQNTNKEANLGGLLVSVREYEAYDESGIPTSNADTLQIANPEAAAIITNGIRPSEINGIGSEGNRYFSITIDEGTAIDLDVYDGEATVQTVDTILKKLNEQFSAGGYSVYAYRIDYDENKPSEIAFVHSIESSATNSYTLKVSRGSDDALDSMGLSDYEDSVIDAGLGTRYYIQGKAYNGLGTKLAETGLELLSGSSQISSTSVNFLEEAICVGDLLVIAESSADDGTYLVTSVHESGSKVGVDSNQLSGGAWTGSSDESTEFYIFKNSLSLADMAFSEIDGSSYVAIIDVFMDYDRSVFYNRRLIYGALSNTGDGDTVSNVVAVVDFAGDVSVYSAASGEGLTLERTVDGVDLIALDGGDPVILGSLSNSYIEVSSGKYDIKLTLFIQDSSAISAQIDDDIGAAGSGVATTIGLYGFEEVNDGQNLLIARSHYEAGSSRVSGAGTDYPRLFSKLRRGNVGHKDLGTDAIYTMQQRPIRETRSNGVVSGLEVTTSVLDSSTDLLTPYTDLDDHESINVNGHYVIDIAGGVCYVKGKRFEISARNNLITGINSPWGPSPDTDKFFVAMNQWGEIVFASSNSSGASGVCSSPFDPYDYCVLCTVEYNGDGSDTTIGDPPFATDLRLFIDQLDLRILNSITVSPQRGMGHFLTINEALKYAKRFSEAYSSAGVPTIHLKSGTHRVIVDHAEDSGTTTDNKTLNARHLNQGIWINFPVNIVGEGYSTVIDIADIYDDSNDLDTRLGSRSADNWSGIKIAGPGMAIDDDAYGLDPTISSSVPDMDMDVINNGFVNLSNFRMRLSSINIIDPSIKDPNHLSDSEGYKLNWGVNIDNVIFDSSECDEGADGAADISYGGIIVEAHDRLEEATDHGAGNISITNCQFLNSAIKFDDFAAANIRNINISNNVSRGSGIAPGGTDMVVDGMDNYLIHCAYVDPLVGSYVAGENIFDFDDCPAINNIQIVGNICADNDGSGSGKIDYDGNHEWSDRLLPIETLAVTNIAATDIIAESITIENSSPSTTQPNLHLIGDDVVFRLGSPDAGGGNCSSRIEFVEDCSGDAGVFNHGGFIEWDGDTPASNGQFVMGTRSSSTTDSAVFKINRRSLSDSLTITEDGVGIGVADSQVPLYVYGGTTGSDEISESNSTGILIVGDTSGDHLAFDANEILARDGSASSSMHLQNSGDSDLMMCANGSGGVAIGTTTPDGHRLNVSGSVNTGDLNVGGSITIDDVSFAIRSGVETLIGSAADDDTLSLWTDYGKALYIDRTGNVAIYDSLSVSSPGHQVGVINVAGSQAEGPCLFIKAGSTSMYGDIATYWSSSSDTYSNLAFGPYNVDEDPFNTGLLGTNFDEKFRMAMKNGRFDVFQSDDDSNSGIRIHQYATHGGDDGILAGTADVRWTIHVRSSYDGNSNVLAFHHKNSYGGSFDGVRAYLNPANNVDELNFTGQHRSLGDKALHDKDNIGLIVISKGFYSNLDGLKKPSINESLPEVGLSSVRNDKKAFGVISDMEDEGSDTRSYSIGAFVSSYAKKEDDERLIINSLGEGAVWICNINGDLENGDYITTCEIPGYGMRQDDDLLHNYTVAKITQDCNFDLNSNNYECVEFEFDGQTYKKAFVGCTYHCG